MPYDLAAHNLRIGLFRFTIAPVQPLEVPAVNKGNMLRGGFGHAFRRLCCVPQCKDTKTCPLATSCPYKAIFEPSPPPGADRLSKNQDIPRPFVFRAPLTRQTRFEPGQPFEFGLVLIGQAIDFLPYFVLSFRELATGGLGLNRAKCTLEKVEEIGAVPIPLEAAPAVGGMDDGDLQPRLIYSSEDQLFRTTETTSSSEWIKRRVQEISGGNNNGAVQCATIRFLTPTFLRADGEVILQPAFHHLFKRLRDRLNALVTFFGDGPLGVDFRGIGERAEKVRTVSAQAGWVERFRTSSRTRQRHELSGFVGEAIYEGDLAEFVPWLALGELAHVGKHAAWGNGWFEVSGSRSVAITTHE
jgi:CRISPR/Cas system endoribonuclease Cas6 (RAMP superfamily)